MGGCLVHLVFCMPGERETSASAMAMDHAGHRRCTVLQRAGEQCDEVTGCWRLASGRPQGRPMPSDGRPPATEMLLAQGRASRAWRPGRCARDLIRRLHLTLSARRGPASNLSRSQRDGPLGGRARKTLFVRLRVSPTGPGHFKAVHVLR
jgi:hypothetical protein